MLLGEASSPSESGGDIDPPASGARLNHKDYVIPTKARVHLISGLRGAKCMSILHPTTASRFSISLLLLSVSISIQAPIALLLI
jgi:hypothetical protein